MLLIEWRYSHECLVTFKVFFWLFKAVSVLHLEKFNACSLRYSDRQIGKRTSVVCKMFMLTGTDIPVILFISQNGAR